MNLGQDMDIFGNMFDDQASDQAGWSNTDDKDKGTADQADTTDKGEDTSDTTKADADKTTWTEIGAWVLDWTDDKKDDTSSDDSDKTGWDDESKPWLKEWETDEILDDLVKDLEDNIDKVDEGWADAKEVLQNTLADLQTANARIKELEDENKTFQDKYYEKFGETSELNLMKPLIQTVQDDPELFLLVKSYKGSDSDSRVNNLVKMLEKETWMDVSSYLTDGWKGAMASTTSTGSDGWMMSKPSSDGFTPNKVQPTTEEELF